jgi:hypothetical protein
MGLNMEGEFRITTDANVVENNATEVRLFGVYKVYIVPVRLRHTPTTSSPRSHGMTIRLKHKATRSSVSKAGNGGGYGRSQSCRPPLPKIAP